ncbi:MAG TPA: DUF2851 family protein [Rubricoccaceae bacterium]
MPDIVVSECPALSPALPDVVGAWTVRTVEPLVVSEPGLDAVPEAVVQHAWGRGLFGRDALQTTEGEAVRVDRTGRLNRASGPDFSGALVHIGGLAWAGDVEIHRTSADWERHGHHTDPAYSRVVLHVVLTADARTGTLRRSDGSALPELVLLPHLDRSLAAVVRDLAAAAVDAPRCRTRWPEVPPALAADWLRALGAARLRSRAAVLGRAYGRRPDLGALLVGRVFRALGYADNADAMETLAARLPLGVVRSLEDPADVLALVVGAAGLTTPLAPDGLADRFAAVAPAGLVPMLREAWHRSGRPANAPRTRLAQAAALVAPGGVLRTDAVARFAAALDIGPDAALDLLRPMPADATPRLGADRARDTFVNAVAPVLLLDAEMRGDAALDARVVETVARLPAARDRITDGFRAAGTPLRRALDAQGAHALARDYCDEGRCARCAVGRHLWPGLVG